MTNGIITFTRFEKVRLNSTHVYIFRYDCRCNRKLVFSSNENLHGRRSSPTNNRSATHSHGESFSSLGSGCSSYVSTLCFNPFEVSGIPYGNRECSDITSSIHNYPSNTTYPDEESYHRGRHQCRGQHSSPTDLANQTLLTDAANQTRLTDSDASGFIHVPMVPRAVTYKAKVKVNRKKVISQQLRTIGRKIRKHGTKTLNMDTLAVL